MFIPQLIAEGGAIKTTVIDEATLAEQQQLEAQAALEQLVSFGNDIKVPQDEMQQRDEVSPQSFEEEAFMEQQMLQQMQQQQPNY